uniref:PID domain-containing protein n=1 Tax=Macrostomum lignano TaxID=282301 RepID=A0A1I8FU94_9PLAT
MHRCHLFEGANRLRCIEALQQKQAQRLPHSSVPSQLPQIIDRPACWCRSASPEGRRTRAPVHPCVPASSGATVGSHTCDRILR